MSDFFGTFVKNSWSKAFLIDMRSLGFYTSIFSIRSIALSEAFGISCFSITGGTGSNCV